MAVDANVLIFERIKEEIKNENNKIIAFDSGYVKSRTAIIDANITTLIAAVILFLMGSGPVKGFSVTLGSRNFNNFIFCLLYCKIIKFFICKNKQG